MKAKDWTGNRNSIYKILGASNHTDKERQNSNGLIKNFKRECQSGNVSKALRITVGVYEALHF